MSNYNFSATINGKQRFPFSLDKDKVSSTLRELVDKIEKKEILVQKARVLTTSDIDDFPVTVLRLTYIEKDDAIVKDVMKKLDRPEGILKKLWSSFSKFPIQVERVK